MPFCAAKSSGMILSPSLLAARYSFASFSPSSFSPLALAPSSAASVASYTVPMELCQWVSLLPVVSSMWMIDQKAAPSTWATVQYPLGLTAVVVVSPWSAAGSVTVNHPPVIASIVCIYSMYLQYVQYISVAFVVSPRSAAGSVTVNYPPVVAFALFVSATAYRP